MTKLLCSALPALALALALCLRLRLRLGFMVMPSTWMMHQAWLLIPGIWLAAGQICAPAKIYRNKSKALVYCPSTMRCTTDKICKSNQMNLCHRRIKPNIKLTTRLWPSYKLCCLRYLVTEREMGRERKREREWERVRERTGNLKFKMYFIAFYKRTKWYKKSIRDK